MSMHRRWLFSSAGKAFMSSALLSFARSAAASEAAKNASMPVRNPPPHPLPQTVDELRTAFNKGTPIQGVMTWGLNGVRTSPTLEESKLKQHLDSLYIDRVTRSFSQINDYGLLLEQAAFLGALTRCMWKAHGVPPDQFDGRHLHWAREGLGFALNSKLQAELLQKCGFVGIREHGTQTPTFLHPQTDQPCALC